MTPRAIQRNYAVPKERTRNAVLLDTNELQHRLKMEHALAEISRELLTEAEPNWRQFLGVLGQEVRADSVYLALVPPENKHAPGWEAIYGIPVDVRQLVDGMDARGLLTWINPERSGQDQPALEGDGWCWHSDPGVVAIPILSAEGRFYGHLGFLFTHPCDSVEVDRQILSMLGDMVSCWLQRKVKDEAYRQLEQQMGDALEQQQQRFGRDLHDGVGSLLTAVRMLSSNLADRFLHSGNDGAALAQKVVRFAEEASQRVREIYSGLAPLRLSQIGLVGGLADLAVDVNALEGPCCAFRHDGVTNVTNKDAVLHLYRIAQEAVNNALKYAEASSIEIVLCCEEDFVVLVIQDDGKGFTLETKHNGNSLGLRSMFYRARAIGGVLSVESKAGTRVTCRLPLPAAAMMDKPVA